MVYARSPHGAMLAASLKRVPRRASAPEDGVPIELQEVATAADAARENYRDKNCPRTAKHKALIAEAEFEEAVAAAAMLSSEYNELEKRYQKKACDKSTHHETWPLGSVIGEQSEENSGGSIFDHLGGLGNGLIDGIQHAAGKASEMVPEMPEIGTEDEKSAPIPGLDALPDLPSMPELPNLPQMPSFGGFGESANEKVKAKVKIRTESAPDFTSCPNRRSSPISMRRRLHSKVNLLRRVPGERGRPSRLKLPRLKLPRPRNQRKIHSLASNLNQHCRHHPL